jgi:hypothetical protein
LSRCLASAPLIRGFGLWAGQLKGGSRSRKERNDHVLRSWVIGTANWDSLAELVLDINIASTLLAKSFRVAVGLVKLSILAKQATVGLTTSGLHLGPLRLGVAWWASIRAKTALLTVWLGSTSDVSLLDAGPLLVTDPFDCDGSVLLWEVVAVNLSVWEWSVDASRSGWLLDWLLGWLRLLGGGGRGCLGQNLAL